MKRINDEIPALSCSVVRELIANDLDKDLTEAMHERVLAHLNGCAECSREAATLKQSLYRVRRAAEALPAGAPAPLFAKRTLDRLLTEFGGETTEHEENDGVQLELWTNPNLP